MVPADNLAHLLKYDSTQRGFKGEVNSEKSSADAEDDTLVVNGNKIKCLTVTKGLAAPSKELGVDIAIESTGLLPKSRSL